MRQTLKKFPAHVMSSRRWTASRQSPPTWCWPGTGNLDHRESRSRPVFPPYCCGATPRYAPASCRVAHMSSRSTANERSNRRSATRSEEHTSELQYLMRISYAVFCLQKNTDNPTKQSTNHKTQQ